METEALVGDDENRSFQELLHRHQYGYVAGDRVKITDGVWCGHEGECVEIKDLAVAIEIPCMGAMQRLYMLPEHCAPAVVTTVAAGKRRRHNRRPTGQRSLKSASGHAYG